MKLQHQPTRLHGITVQKTKRYCEASTELPLGGRRSSTSPQGDTTRRVVILGHRVEEVVWVGQGSDPRAASSGALAIFVPGGG